MQFCRLFGMFVFVTVVAAGIGHAIAQSSETGEKQAQTAYRELLDLFPEDSQGYGKDWFLMVTDHQPMTYGFVLSAEAIHFRGEPNDESRRRVHKAVRWLIDNSDLDRDGLPGWGLPQAWDAWSDGTTNAPNQPYTITTAIVLDGLIEAMEIPGFWNDTERKEICQLVVRVVMRWCRDVWSEGYSGGYFWYSPGSNDNTFGINAPAMFLGSVVRLVRHHGGALTSDERSLAVDRMDRLAQAIVATVNLKDGEPFWLYAPMPNKFKRTTSNDLVHHVYTLWGIERYRDCGGNVKLPWSRSQAAKSLDRFWSGDHITSLPQESATAPTGKNPRPARLWDVGMLMAGYAQWGERAQAVKTLEVIRRDYGQWPKLRYYPKGSPKADEYFPRDAAHVLFGLALHAYSLRP